LVAAGCDLFNNALQVQTPSNIPAGSLEVPANAGLLGNSAIGDFECAAGAYAAMSGLITDELKDATQTADRYPYELRTMLSSDRLFKLAVAAFSDAIAGGNSDIVNMARVGRARAYLDLGQPVLARADALLVPAAYVKSVSASGINARRNNRVWQESDTTFDNTSIDSVYVRMNDPRVPIGNKNRSSVTGIPLFFQKKFASMSSPIRLASGDEARLITAEAYIRTGAFAAADSIINFFRALGGQGAITSPDSATAS